jgi:hypothetical protein
MPTTDTMGILALALWACQLPKEPRKLQPLLLSLVFCYPYQAKFHNENANYSHNGSTGFGSMARMSTYQLPKDPRQLQPLLLSLGFCQPYHFCQENVHSKLYIHKQSFIMKMLPTATMALLALAPWPECQHYNCLRSQGNYNHCCCLWHFANLTKMQNKMYT